MTSSPHDALFRFTFSQPEHAGPLIRSNLPAELAERIDWTTLALRPGSFVDADLAFRHTDLLFSARIDGHGAMLYVLVEHQSTADPLMPFRVLRYVVRIWDDCLKNDDRAGRLPAVIPIIVYHGKSEWSAPVRLQELVDLDAAALHAIAAHLPELMIVFLPAEVVDAPADLKETLRLQVGPPALEALMTAGEKLIEEGRQQGLARGRAEIVLKQLSLRFGPLPEAAVQRIRSASIAELDVLAERVLTAATLDEALA